MTAKVYLRFSNENQWLAFCEAARDGAPLDLLDDLMVEWCWAETDQPMQPATSASFREFANALKQRWPQSYLYGIELIISGANTVGAKVNIPSKQMRHIHQALPFMVEDQLAQDVSQFHLIHGNRNNDGDLDILGLPLHLLDTTRQLFAEQNLPLDAVVADMLCLPLTDNEWTFLADGKHLLIRQSELVGVAIEIDAAPVVLASILDHWQPSPGMLRVLLCKGSANDHLISWIKTQINSAVADRSIQVEFTDLAADYFSVLCSQLRTAPRKNPANFLQGTFAAKGRRKPTSFPWKPLAALAATFVIVYTAFLYTQSWKYRAEHQRIESETVALYKRLFPADQRIVNIKRQMEQHIQNIQRGQGGDSFLVLMTLTGQQIQLANRATGDAIKPQRASYDTNQGGLQLDLLVKDFNQLEGLKSRLESVQLLVETASAAQDAGVVKARLKIRSQRT